MRAVGVVRTLLCTGRDGTIGRRRARGRRRAMARQRGVVVLAVIFAMLMGLEVVAQAAARRAAESDDRPWKGALERMDRAVAASDISAAERAMHDAYVAAVASRRWDAMVAVGDAYGRLGVASHEVSQDRARARQAYLAAFFL